MAHGHRWTNFGLTRRFAVVGGLIIVMACLAIGYFSREGVRRDLLSVAESNNVVLAHTFSSLIWPKYADFFTAAGSMDIWVLRGHAVTRALRKEVLTAI